MRSARDKNPRSWLILLQTWSQWPNTSLVGWQWAPEMLYFFHQPSVSWGKCLQSQFIRKLSGWTQSFWGCLVLMSSSYLFRRELSGLAPPRELASRAVIYTIYLFLALGPLANCMSWCWISLEFNHALFSLQLNYLYIWLTFSLPGSQIFSETTNKHRPVEFQACLLENLPVCLSVKNTVFTVYSFS